MTKKNCICGICPGDCQVEIELIDGHIKNIKPSDEKKPSAICLRGLYSDEIVNSNDRLKKPLIRVGKKGVGNSGKNCRCRLTKRKKGRNRFDLYLWYR